MLETATVGKAAVSFAFDDAGASCFPSELWTIISRIGFATSRGWLDRTERSQKRLARAVVKQPEDLAVPIAQ